MLSLETAEAQVIVGALVFVASMAALMVQNHQGVKSQRGDHAATADMVREMRNDVREMKADVRDVKDEVRSHGDRLRNLEHMTVTQDHTDRIVSENFRKLQAIQDHNEEQAS